MDSWLFINLVVTKLILRLKFSEKSEVLSTVKICPCFLVFTLNLIFIWFSAYYRGAFFFLSGSRFYQSCIMANILHLSRVLKYTNKLIRYAANK